MLARSRVQIFSPAFTSSPASTYTAVHLAVAATITEVWLSADTLPDTLLSVATELSWIVRVCTATPVAAPSVWAEELSPLLWQPLRASTTAPAVSRDKIRLRSIEVLLRQSVMPYSTAHR